MQVNGTMEVQQLTRSMYVAYLCNCLPFQLGEVNVV